MPDANAFASIGFTDVSDYFSQAYPESAVPTDDWPFFYMVERSYPVTYMIALGMMLSAQLCLRAQDHRLHRSDRPQLFALLLSRLRLHAGGNQGHHRTRVASWRDLVRYRGRHHAGAGDGVPGEPDRDAEPRCKLAGPAYFGLFASLLVGYGLATSHGQWMFGPPLMQLALSCLVLTIPLFFAGIIFSSLIGEAGSISPRRLPTI